MGEKISTILSQIDSGSVALPEFQRGYVWNRDQVRGLMTSLYKGYPVGSLLVWETQSSGARGLARGVRHGEDGGSPPGRDGGPPGGDGGGEERRYGAGEGKEPGQGELGV